MRYAVVWSTDAGHVYAGSLDLGEESLSFEGAVTDSFRELSFAELVDARIERGASLRLGGRPTLVLWLADGRRVKVASLEGRGTLHELADRLATARARVRP